MKKSRAWAKLLIAASMILLCGSLSLYAALPGMVRREALEEMRRRGWSGEVGQVEIFWDRFVLYDVRAASDDGWVEAYVSRVVVERVGLGAGDVTMDGVQAKLSGPRPERKEGTGSPTRRKIIIKDASVEWTGLAGNGSSASARGVEVVRSAESTTVSADTIEVEHPAAKANLRKVRWAGDAIEMDEANVELRREKTKGTGSGTSATGWTKGAGKVRVGHLRIAHGSNNLEAAEVWIDAQAGETLRMDARAGSLLAKGLSARGVQIEASAERGGLWEVSVRARADSISASVDGTGGPMEVPDVAVDAELAVDRSAGRYEVRSSVVKVGSLTLSATGDLSPDRLRMSVSIPETGCQEAWSSLPLALRGGLAGAILDGTVSLHVDVGVDLPQRSRPLVLFLLDNRCKVKSLPKAYRVSALAGKFRRNVVAADGTMTEVESGPGSEFWTPVGHLSRHVPAAVMATEDQFFLTHRGIMNKAVENSMEMNIRDGRFTRGASTITMQLAKNLWLGREKTAARKVQEALLTTYLEQVWSKDRILEYYVNVVEFAPDVYGIGRAAHHYFRTDATQLTLSQSLFLASVLPSPSKIHFGPDGELHGQRLSLIRRVMKGMQHDGRISSEEYAEAVAEVPRFRAPVRREGGDAIEVSEGGVDPAEWE